MPLGVINAVQQGTTRTLGTMTPDGYTWAQGTPMVVIQDDIIIAQVQHVQAGTLYNGFVTSNDRGLTWVDVPQTGFFNAHGEGFIVRGGMAWDSANNKIHMLWAAADPADGMIYRRYSVTIAAGAVTGISRDAGINLQLDVNASAYQHPVMIWIPEGTNGRLIAAWTAEKHTATVAAQIRASTILLANDATDGSAANWDALKAVPDTETFGTVSVDYTALKSVSGLGVLYGSLAYAFTGTTDLGSLYLLYATDADWRIMAFAKTGTGRWETITFDSFVVDMHDGGATGYGLKHQLGTEPRRHPVDGKWYFGVAIDMFGNDMWQVARVSPIGLVQVVINVYAATNPDADRFVTGDVAIDQNSGLVVSTFTTLPDKFMGIMTIDPVTMGIIDYTETAFTAAPVDIPTLVNGTYTDPITTNNNLWILFRDFNAEAANIPPTYTPPYDGYFVSVELFPAAGTPVTLHGANPIGYYLDEEGCIAGWALQVKVVT